MLKWQSNWTRATERQIYCHRLPVCRIGLRCNNSAISGLRLPFMVRGGERANSKTSNFNFVREWNETWGRNISNRIDHPVSWRAHSYYGNFCGWSQACLIQYGMAGMVPALLNRHMSGHRARYVLLCFLPEWFYYSGGVFLLSTDSLVFFEMTTFSLSI